MIKTTGNVNKKLAMLFSSIVGNENVLTDTEDMIMYATDSACVSNDLYLPDYVLFPRTTQEVSDIMKIAYASNLPVTTRGAGTNMAGCCVPLKGGIVLSLTKMNKIIDIDEQNQTITVEAGVVVGDMQEAAEKIGLFYPPDPSNLKVSTIGGSLALSSSGPRTFKYGGTKDYVLSLEVVLANGEILNIGSANIKDVAGYNLIQLFVGSEGTLGIITKAVFRLIPKPEAANIMIAYFKKLDDAARCINDIIMAKFVPSVLDIMDKKTMQTIENYSPAGFLTENEAALFIEIDGDKKTIKDKIHSIKKICEKNKSSQTVIANGEEGKENIWRARRSAFSAITQSSPNVISEDMVVPRAKMPEMLEKTYEIGKRFSVEISVVGHAGDGNFHPHIAFDLRNIEEAERVNNAISELFKTAVDLGGSITGEHGIGALKAPYLKDSINSLSYSYMKQIKNMFDEKNILNPQKVFGYEFRQF